MYHISIQGKIIGTFNHNEVLRALGDGTFSVADHYWKAGMIDWKPLKQFKTGEFITQNQNPSTNVKILPVKEDKLASQLGKFLGLFFLGLIFALLNSKSSRSSERDYDRYDTGD
jgi:hypothetical protein